MASRSNLQHLPLVRACAFLPFVSFLREIGAPVDRLLSAARLPVHSLDNPDALIPLLNACRFLEDAARREDIPTLGFQVGQRTPVECLGTFGLLIRQSVTLWEALNTAQKLSPAINSGFRVRLEQQGDSVWVHHENGMQGTCGSQHADGFGLTLIANLIRHAIDLTWRPRAVRLPISPDRDVADLDLFSAASLQYQQTSSAIALPAALLSQPLAALRGSHNLPRAEATEWLQSSAPASDIAGSVTQFLHTQLSVGCQDIKLTAEATGLSVRTLQRRLFEKGYDYSKLFDHARFDLAVELLERSDLKIVDIAQELGYGDAANFTRAFRRWTGISPLEFRKAADLTNAFSSSG